MIAPWILGRQVGHTMELLALDQTRSVRGLILLLGAKRSTPIRIARLLLSPIRMGRYRARTVAAWLLLPLGVILLLCYYSVRDRTLGNPNNQPLLTEGANSVSFTPVLERRAPSKAAPVPRPPSVGKLFVDAKAWLDSYCPKLTEAEESRLL